MGVTVTLPPHISGHSAAAWVSASKLTEPTGDTSPGLHVGARVTASLSYFPAQPCVWFCFVLCFCSVLLQSALFFFALRGWLLWGWQWEGVPWCSSCLSITAQSCSGAPAQQGPSQSTFCLLTDLVVLLVNVPASPCKEQLAHVVMESNSINQSKLWEHQILKL